MQHRFACMRHLYMQTLRLNLKGNQIAALSPVMGTRKNVTGKSVEVVKYPSCTLMVSSTND